MRIFYRLLRLFLAGTQLEPLPVRSDREDGPPASVNARHNRQRYGLREAGQAGAPAAGQVLRRRSSTLWMGISVVFAISLVGFIGNIGEDTWGARLIVAVSVVLLGLSGIMAVVFAMVERQNRRE